LRLFVALEIPAAVRDNLSALVRELRPLAPQARWVRVENLHVTLKFIGEAPPEKSETIQKTLSAIPAEGPIVLDFHGMGFFPDERRPRVFWVGITAGPELAGLAAEIESRLEPLGIPRERRAFSPHLTLARFQEPGNTDGIRAVARERNAQSFGVHTARKFCLFQSQLKPDGAQHTRLAAFPFAQKGA
jgi:RNA 2',3'-cyclic 3'-phosphodiesterase